MICLNEAKVKYFIYSILIQAKCWERLNSGQKWRTGDKMVGWHHWLNGHEFKQTPGAGEGQGSLVWCSLWGHKESDITEKLNKKNNSYIKNSSFIQLLSFSVFTKLWNYHCYSNSRIFSPPPKKAPPPLGPLRLWQPPTNFLSLWILLLGTFHTNM